MRHKGTSEEENSEFARRRNEKNKDRMAWADSNDGSLKGWKANAVQGQWANYARPNLLGGAITPREMTSDMQPHG